MQTLKTALLLLASAFFASGEAPKPNIIFIFCDDLGYGDVGVFHQNERAAKKDASVPYFHTPHLDAMANGGIQFRQHYCSAPVCAPSRASLLLGVHQGHSPIRDNQFDKELPDTHTIGSVLKEAGYATAAFGKWGLQGSNLSKEERKKDQPMGAKFPDWPSTPVDRGFDYYFGFVRHRDGHRHYPVEDKKQVWENKTEVSKGMELCFTTDLFTAAAKRWIIDQHKKSPDQPFMVYLAHDTPHAILQNPPCAYPEGGGLKGGVQWLGKEGNMINTAQGKYDSWMHPDYAKATWDHDKDPKTPEVEWPDVQRRYANNVRRIDDTVGDLMQLMVDLKIADNTLIIFSTDNGPSQESYLKGKPYHPDFFHGFGPFDGIKRDTLEGGLRVPTIAHWPAKTKAGSISTAPSGHWDWLPTFAEAAGLPAPAASDGVSLLPTLRGKSDTVDQIPSTIYSEYSVGGKTPNYKPFHKSNQGKPRGQMQVIHIDGYKGIRTSIKDGTEPFRIYDVNKDTQEVNDLASKEGMNELQKRMQAKVLQSRIPNPTAQRPYDRMMIPAMEGEPRGMNGTAAHYVMGKFSWIPNLRHEGALSLNPKGFNPPPQKMDGPHAVKLEAAVLIPKDGTYSIKLQSDVLAMVFCHDIRLLDEGSGNREEKLPLKAGWHPIELLYLAGDKAPTLSFEIVGADGKTIPLEPGKQLKSLSPGW